MPTVEVSEVSDDYHHSTIDPELFEIWPLLTLFRYGKTFIQVQNEQTESKQVTMSSRI